MKDTVTENRRKINYIFTIISIIGLIAGIGLFVYDYNLEQRAININAKITALDYKDGSYKATVKYKVDKESYNQVVTITNDAYTVNDEVPIKYDIENPGQLINNNHYIIAIPLIALSLLILLASIKGTIKNIKRSSNIKHLLTKGIYVQANISEIIVDNKGRKNKGKFPYKLRAKFTNPLDNQIYTYDSESTYLDLNAIIKQYNNKLILVYLDKNNTSNYYVDLDSLFPHVKLVDVGEMMGEKKQVTQEVVANEGESTEKNEDQSNVAKTEDKKEENSEK